MSNDISELTPREQKARNLAKELNGLLHKRFRRSRPGLANTLLTEFSITDSFSADQTIWPQVAEHIARLNGFQPEDVVLAVHTPSTLTVECPIPLQGI